MATKLSINHLALTQLLDNRLQTIQLHHDEEKIQSMYAAYVLDMDDAHIVAGAKAAKARFLISYNLKDFRENKN